jgi:hypothetical protein
MVHRQIHAEEEAATRWAGYLEDLYTQIAALCPLRTASAGGDISPRATSFSPKGAHAWLATGFWPKKGERSESGGSVLAGKIAHIPMPLIPVRVLKRVAASVPRNWWTWRTGRADHAPVPYAERTVGQVECHGHPPLASPLWVLLQSSRQSLQSAPAPAIA